MIELKSDSCSDPIGVVIDHDPLYATTLGIIVDDFAHLSTRQCAATAARFAGVFRFNRNEAPFTDLFLAQL